jgi:transcriptional regulator with XRE-family HTH domain
MEFRSRIKELCQLRGITQKDLADKLGITDISLNKTLRGDYPQLQTLEKISSALNVEIWELFTPSVSKEELTALVDHRGRLYKANSIEELQGIIEEIKQEK